MLEKLADLKEIDGFKIVRPQKERDAYNPCHGSNHIIIDDEENTITFRLQKDDPTHGCRINTVIEAALLILDELSFSYFCGAKAGAVKHLSLALLELSKLDDKEGCVQRRQ
jgi:hypothetical protein